MREQPQPKPKTSEPKPAATENKEEAKRPVWFLGQDQQPAPRAPKINHVENKGSEDEKRQRHLDAYKRYKQMREATAVKQREEFDEDEAPLKSRRLPAYNPDARVSPRRTDEWFDDAYGNRPRKQRRTKQYRTLTRDFAIAGVLSVLTGLVAGVVVYDRTSNGVVTQGILSLFDGAGNAQAEGVAVAQPIQPAETQQPAVETKKPIATATLDVADVAGSANALVPLSLRAMAAEPGQKVAFRLSGLPEAAMLTAGIKINQTTWQLRPGEENGVRLKLPPNQTQSFVIAVEAIEPTTNELVSPIHDLNVAVAQPQQQQIVQPAASEAPEIKRNFNLQQQQPAADLDQEQIIDEQPPAQLEQQQQPSAVAEKQQPAGQTQVAAAMPIPSPMEEQSAEPMAETLSLMKNGDKLMTMGDPAGARQFYLKALNLGDKQAALKVGQTYDPTVYSEMNVQGLKPDPQLALRYYLEARTAGDPEAETAIAGLDSWMQK